MPANISKILTESGPDSRRRLFAVYAVLIGGNILIWLWALAALGDRSVLLGTALLAYTFGLRHAVDADHIAAIDNVTRKLMQQGQRPVGVGFFFSLGHSAVVVLMSIGVAFAASALTSRFDSIKSVGGIIGTSVSALFLFAIAIFNIIVLRSIYRTFQAVKRGKPFVEEDFDVLLNNRGFSSAHLPAPVPARHQELAHVSGRVPVRPGLRHRDRSRPVRHLSRAGDERRIPGDDHGVSGPVRRRHDLDRHDGRGAHARRLWLGVHETDPQALL